MFSKILIANRGEIAIRIAKTCRNMRIKTVGVYSEQDKDSMHLKFCDEVFSLGGDPLKGSYLNINKIIDINYYICSFHSKKYYANFQYFLNFFKAF